MSDVNSQVPIANAAPAEQPQIKPIAQNVQDAAAAQAQAQLQAMQQQQAQQQQMMQYIEQQVQQRLMAYNLDIQRLALSAQTIEAIAKARATGFVDGSQLHTFISHLEQKLHDAIVPAILDETAVNEVVQPQETIATPEATA